MSTYESLKKTWKKLGINGHVKNYSSIPLWVLETDSGKAIAHLLKPGMKSPPTADADAFRRRDGLPIEEHKSWWKIYDGTNVEISDRGKGLWVAAITKSAVFDWEFANPAEKIVYDESAWGEPIRLVTDIRRDKKQRIEAYLVTGLGWLEPEKMLTLTCKHEIDNARPVFPRNGTPFIRTRRDGQLFNNLETKGLI